MKKQRDLGASLTVVVAFVGVWLVLAPDFSSFKPGNLWGLASGTTAAAAIIYLNVSRQYHDTDTILFFMFGLGSAFIYLLYRKHIFMPDPQALFYLLMCAGFGVVGQYLLTLGVPVCDGGRGEHRLFRQDPHGRTAGALPGRRSIVDTHRLGRCRHYFCRQYLPGRPAGGHPLKRRRAI